MSIKIKSQYPVDKKELEEFVRQMRLGIDPVFEVDDVQVSSVIDELISKRVLAYLEYKLDERPLNELLVLREVVKEKSYVVKEVVVPEIKVIKKNIDEDKEGQEVPSVSSKAKATGSEGKPVKGKGRAVL